MPTGFQITVQYTVIVCVTIHTHMCVMYVNIFYRLSTDTISKIL